MLKIEINKGNLKLSGNGNVKELLADVCTIIYGVYSNIDNDDHKEEFKDGFESAMKYGLVWKTPEEVENEEHKLKEAKEELRDALAKKLLDSLRDIINDDEDM